jgi:hypothetical protein
MWRRQILLHSERELQPEPDFGAESEQELDSLQADFPDFEIWREQTGYGTCYIARGRTLGVHPHTVMAGDPSTIRAALAGSPPPPQPGTGDAATPGLAR